MVRTAMALLVSLAVSGDDQAGRLVVSERHVDTGSVYIEGALQYLVIRRRDTGRAVVRRRYARGVWLNKALAPGRYRLVSYTRSCVGTCPPRDPEPCTGATCPVPGGLDPPVDRCARGFTVTRGRTLRASLRTGVGIRCEARFSPHRIAIRAESAAETARARRLRRRLRRNAGAAGWYPAVKAIEAQGRALTVLTSLSRNRRGRAAARELCTFAPGHDVEGRGGKRIATCPRSSP